MKLLLTFFASAIISKPLSSYAFELRGRELADGGVLTDADKQAILDEHNKQRSDTALGKTGSQPMATNMIKLKWDDDLASSSKAYANNCIFAHPGGLTVGENLAMAASSANDVDNIERLLLSVDDFYQEYKDYTYDTLSCTPGKACGHYTQNVWATTSKVGCGYAECSNFGLPYGYLLVCRYSPAGNYVGVFPYEKAANSALVASNCPSGYTADSASGLCVDAAETPTAPTPTAPTPTAPTPTAPTPTAPTPTAPTPTAPTPTAPTPTAPTPTAPTPTTPSITTTTPVSPIIEFLTALLNLCIAF